MAPTATSSAHLPTRRSGHHPLARRDLACHQQGAEAQHQTILVRDESGLYPLPSVVRPDALIGPTPGLREWWPREHLSALSARSPEGKVYCHRQESALHAADIVVFLEHLRREGPGRLVVIWDGAPIHRRQTIQDFLANGAGQRLHVERLPADAPELHPDEGCWAQPKGVELRHVCGFNLLHLGHERRDAVRRVRRKPRIIQECFKGAGL